jgi:phage tail-like protein
MTTNQFINPAVTYPLHVFRFYVEFTEDRLSGGESQQVTLCDGAFSECTGLEATMEPKVIQEGGHNYGAHQRVGPVTFATVILKRGITTTRHLWQWFEFVTNSSFYTYRLTVKITLLDHSGSPLLAWQLDRALPVKFKGPDFNATATEVGIEELHLAHEGLTLLKIS